MTRKCSRIVHASIILVCTALAQQGYAATSIFTTSLTADDRFDSLSAAEAGLRSSGSQASSLEFDSIQNESGIGVVRRYSLPPVEPITGPWQYGNNRCGNIQWGFTSESDAVDAGMARFYSACGGASVHDPGYWGTLQRRTRGSCGSTQLYPHHTNGIESLNTRKYKIEYCGARDGLTIYRSRHVTGCPNGYSPTYNGLTCTSGFTATITETFNRKNNGCSKQGLGNPCDPSTGNKYQNETDFRLQGLSFSRAYNSGEAEDAGLGKGWTSNLHKRLIFSGSRLSPIESDGRATVWSTDGSSWQADADVSYKLKEDASGFWITRVDGKRQHYSHDGDLKAEIAPSGRTLTYGYDQWGRLTSVTNHFGMLITLSYDGDDHVSSITTPAGHSYRYDYDTNDNLVGVEYPGGKSRIYHYEDPRFPNHLTGITDENGDRYATFTYDTQGRAASTEHAVTDNGSAQEKYVLEYQQ